MSDPQVLARILPGYEIGPELGRGGFGVVLSGRHRQLGRQVAIKQLPPGLAGDAGVRSRFLAEGRVLAGLDHPNVVPVYDFVEQDGLCVLVMEALPGGTVWGQFTDRGYTPSAACAMVMVACSGLHHAHEHGVLHRDVKPENLLLTATGQLKVADFGIAKVLGDNDALATGAGDILGTPAYMAPEQALGADLGPGADVYAAGVLLYELLSGRLPFSEDGGALAIVYRHVHELPTPLLQVAPELPPGLAEVVMRALSRDPSERYASAEDFGVAIGEAASAVFGRGWLQDTAVPVLGGGRILDSTRPLPGASAPPPPSSVVLPRAQGHVMGSPVEASADGVVPVRQVLANPPWPLPWALLAAVLLGVLALLALHPTAPPKPRAGALIVDGQDAARLAAVDLAKPFALSARGLPGARAATEARVQLKVAGIALPAASVSAPRAGAIRVDARGSRYLAGGPVQATATFLRGGRVLSTTSFPLRPKGSRFLSVPGIVAGLAVLLGLAYAESQLAPLRRRGRRRNASLVGLVFAGALLGALAAVFGWLLGDLPLQAADLARCAGVGAAAGVVLGVTAYRAGRRSRLRRIARLRGLESAARR